MSFERAYVACKMCYQNRVRLTVSDDTQYSLGADSVQNTLMANIAKLNAIEALELELEKNCYSDTYKQIIIDAKGICTHCDYKSPKIAELLRDKRVIEKPKGK